MLNWAFARIARVKPVSLQTAARAALCVWNNAGNRKVTRVRMNNIGTLSRVPA